MRCPTAVPGRGLISSQKIGVCSMRGRDGCCSTTRAAPCPCVPSLHRLQLCRIRLNRHLHRRRRRRRHHRAPNPALSTRTHPPTQNPPKTHPPPHLKFLGGRFPPGTVNLPPAAPRVGLPPTSTVELGSTSVALLALAGAALLAFGGLQFYFMSLFRASAAAMRKTKKKDNLIAVAQIDNTTGRARVITGVAVGGSGRRGNYIAERQSLLTGQKL